MKKVITLTIALLAFSFANYAQVNNPLFEKNKFSVNFVPTFGSNGTWGITSGVGYNVFKKTEVGLNVGYINYSQSSGISSEIYGKYYFINRKFTPYTKIAYNFSNNFTDKETSFFPSAELGIGYYGIAKYLGIELGVLYTYPEYIGPNINFKWFF